MAAVSKDRALCTCARGCYAENHPKVKSNNITIAIKASI